MTQPRNTAWTDDQITVATYAAAEHAYNEQVKQAREILPPAAGAALPTWDEVDQGVKNGIVDAVIPIVWAVLTALPEPRYGAWVEGFVAAKSGEDVIDDNPYPSGA